MSAHTDTPMKYFVGAQNDSLFIVVGEPPAKGNDSPRHDANRTPIAHVYDEIACDALVRAGNEHDDLVKAIVTCHDRLASGNRNGQDSDLVWMLRGLLLQHGQIEDRNCDNCAKGSLATGALCQDRECRTDSAICDGHSIGKFPRWQRRAALANASA